MGEKSRLTRWSFLNLPECKFSFLFFSFGGLFGSCLLVSLKKTYSLHLWCEKCYIYTLVPLVLLHSLTHLSLDGSGSVEAPRSKWTLFPHLNTRSGFQRNDFFPSHLGFFPREATRKKGRSERMRNFSVLVVFGLILSLGSVMCNVSYDRKALLINGQRRILFSGSIHYPRSTPEVLHFLSDL